MEVFEQRLLRRKEISNLHEMPSLLRSACPADRLSSAEMLVSSPAVAHVKFMIVRWIDTNQNIDATFLSSLPWRNRLARSAVNRKVGGSSPPGSDWCFARCFKIQFEKKNAKKRDNASVMKNNILEEEEKETEDELTEGEEEKQNRSLSEYEDEVDELTRHRTPIDNYFNQGRLKICHGSDNKEDDEVDTPCSTVECDMRLLSDWFEKCDDYLPRSVIRECTGVERLFPRWLTYLAAVFGKNLSLQVVVMSKNQLEYASAIGRAIDKKKEDVVLVLHNIDGPGLRTTLEQWALAEFAKAKHTHIIATVDHINKSLLWAQKLLNAFNFLFINVNTMQAYKTEVYAGYSKLLGLNLKDSRYMHTQASLDVVWMSLTNNSRSLLHLISNYYYRKKKPVEFFELYRLARDEFLVSTDTALRQHLNEYSDHRLITRKHHSDGNEYISMIVEKKFKWNNLAINVYDCYAESSRNVGNNFGEDKTMVDFMKEKGMLLDDDDSD
ncbi:hypothetical protein DINM_004696 [Dirofilaria immitis]|nr:hypothetical protein [Dirofilaria immitis]